MKTRPANLNFLCNFSQLPLPNIALFTVLFTADDGFFACFLVRDLCRSGCRHNYHPRPAPVFLSLPSILSLIQVTARDNQGNLLVTVIRNQCASKVGFGAV